MWRRVYTFVNRSLTTETKKKAFLLWERRCWEEKTQCGTREGSWEREKSCLLFSYHLLLPFRRRPLKCHRYKQLSLPSKKNCFLWFVNCCLGGNQSFPFFLHWECKNAFRFCFIILFCVLLVTGDGNVIDTHPIDARIIKPSKKKRRHLDLSIACPSARVCGAVNSITISNTHVSSFDGGQPKSLVTLC